MSAASEPRWTSAQRRARRQQYANNHAHTSGMTVGNVKIPDTVTILTGDPSPCFRCGVKGGCRHRPWEAA